MRKNGKRFQVDIVEGAWFSTIHESNVASRIKECNHNTLHTLSTNYHIGHTFAVRNQKTTTVSWKDVQEKETGWKGILQNSFSLTLVL